MESPEYVANADVTVQGLGLKNASADTIWRQGKTRTRWPYLSHFTETVSFPEENIGFGNGFVLVEIQKEQ